MINQYLSRGEIMDKRIIAFIALIALIAIMIGGMGCEHTGIQIQSESENL